ncbi:MAG: hypothetical protein WCK70_05720, partial [Chloroflexales bacterium]
MAFRPNIDDVLEIDDTSYRVAAHPAAPGMPYGQEGRQGIVFQMIAQDGTCRALKVFKPRFRIPALVTNSLRLAAFANIPGLAVCSRIILTPRQHTLLLRIHPDLAYAVLMPWITGPSWMDCILDRRQLTAEQSLALSRALADLLATLEERGIAHGDLSGPNLLLPALAQPQAGPPAALVDVEQLYAPGLDRPEVVVSGSSGYAHHTAAQSGWSASGDRFAGAMLLAEILGWSDPQVRAVAGEESYFEPEELQQPGQRYSELLRCLEDRWGTGVARLFERAWQSATLADCPTFGEWLVALPDAPRANAAPPTSVAPGMPPAPMDGARALLGLADTLRTQGNRDGALTAYRQALSLLPPDDGLTSEIRLLIDDLAKDRPAGTQGVSRAASVVAPAEDRPQRRRKVWPLVLVAVLVVVLLSSLGIFFQTQAATYINSTTTAQAQAQELSITAQMQQSLDHAATIQSGATASAQLAGTAAAVTEMLTATAVAQGTSTALILAEAQTVTAHSAAATTTAAQIAMQEAQTATANEQAAAQATIEANAVQSTQQAQSARQASQATAQAQAARQASQATAQAQAARQAS